METKIINGSKYKLIITPEEIHKKYRQIIQRIKNDYNPQTEILFTCIMKGGIFPLTDLVRIAEKENLPYDISYIELKGEFGGGSNITCVISNDNFKDKDIILIKNITSSGDTTEYITGIISAYSPASLKIFTAIQKGTSNQTKIKIDYCCFKLPEGHYAGEGLKANGHRGLQGFWQKTN